MSTSSNNADRQVDFQTKEVSIQISVILLYSYYAQITYYAELDHPFFNSK